MPLMYHCSCSSASDAGCRVIVEHAFGRLKRRFPFIACARQQTITQRVNTVWACCILHNFIIDAGGSASLSGVHRDHTEHAALESWINRCCDVDGSDASDYEEVGRPTSAAVQEVEGELLSLFLFCLNNSCISATKSLEAKKVRLRWYQSIIDSLR